MKTNLLSYCNLFASACVLTFLTRHSEAFLKLNENGLSVQNDPFARNGRNRNSQPISSTQFSWPTYDPDIYTCTIEHSMVIVEEDEISINVEVAMKTEGTGLVKLHFNDGQFAGLRNIRGWCVDLGRGIAGRAYKFDVFSSLDISGAVHSDAVDNPENLGGINYLINESPTGTVVTIPDCVDNHAITDQEFQLATWMTVDNASRNYVLNSWKGEDHECVVDYLVDLALRNKNYVPDVANCYTGGTNGKIGVLLVVDDDDENILNQVLFAEIEIGHMCDCQTPLPSALPSENPTDSPTTANPTGSPTRYPTNTPTGNPTGSPTKVPTSSPTVTASAQPSPLSSGSPTLSGQPTKGPTDAPTTTSPTSSPTRGPTKGPTDAPTSVPTKGPTSSPTVTASAQPSTLGSGSPTLSGQPTKGPTDAPTTTSPTSSPTKGPTEFPTSAQPSTLGSGSPTLSGQPTKGPTDAPTTTSPTSSPTRGPTKGPTEFPTSAQPSTLGSGSPTLSGQPTKGPTDAPTTTSPTSSPTKGPTKGPTEGPTSSPTVTASARPSVLPSVYDPGNVKTEFPTEGPTNEPTKGSTAGPTSLVPTTQPTGPDTNVPTPQSTGPDTSAPSPQSTGPDTSAPTLQPTEIAPSSQPTKDTNQGANGDPHFKTWSGERYDFHGICDLILLSNPKFNDNLGMDIYIRSKKTKQWSYISTAVVRIGVETFEVSGRKDGDTYWVNGIEGDGNGDDCMWDEGTNIAGFPVTFKRVHSTQRQYTIDIGENNEKIIFKTWKDFVRVDVINPRDEDFTGSLGLMGSYPDGKNVGRSDPSSLIKDKNIFGQEWQVQFSDPQLFHSIEGPQSPTRCELPSKSALRRRLSKSEISREDAETSCAHIIDTDERDLCIFDILATNDITTADAY